MAEADRPRLTIAHQLSVVGLGAYTGVMIAIGLGLGRYWLSLPPAAFVAWFAPNFWFLLPCVGITLPFALYGTLVSWRRAPSATVKRQWRTVSLLVLGTVAVTLVYHLPANFRIWSGELGDEQVKRELVWWLVAHVLRVGPALVATLLALRATVDDLLARPELPPPQP